ncbi:tetratricopeptide (TPR) repeat protein [Oxalobacteraceae bacterium GrIS 2.11]
MKGRKLYDLAGQGQSLSGVEFNLWGNSKVHSISNNQIDELVSSVIQQQGLHFSSHNEAQQYLKKTRLEMHACFEHSVALLTEGLQHLQAKPDGYVRGYVSKQASRILNDLHTPQKLSAIVAEITQDEHALLYFTQVVKELFDCGEDHKALSATTVLMALFPLDPQPYIFLGTIIWRKDGVTAAASYYEKMIEFIHHPAFCFFAADCFKKNGNRENAIAAIHRALAVADQANDADARHHLLEFLKQL